MNKHYQKLTRKVANKHGYEYPSGKVAKQQILDRINNEFDSTSADFASDMDLLYFQQNPTAVEYRRDAIPGELPGKVDYVIVRQIKPGFRARCGFDARTNKSNFIVIDGEDSTFINNFLQQHREQAAN